MPDRIRMERAAPAHPAVRSLIIVARDQRDLWGSLVHEFQAVARIQILLDRRRGERRRPSDLVADDRRTRDRRRLPRLEDDLHARQYVLVRPHDRRPHD